MKPKQFCLVTNKNFVENVKRLALMEAMTTNEFIVKVLTDYCLSELQDPLLYRQKIPDY
jgi:hypothetical protein